ncbi:hypothetical protein P280DRAFT_507929 [Massarina eburnea CBS 473.64]|uniref:Uncharacterized protein n=1 Tax=Massarina eburnea CBS 473.64 TaxID=1395130 RepID=A0A6A6RYC8_9PLEO|nr:hypothetical protein P280DRAFT_507929 [Massarina eburnea CBS 473.64]
MWSLVRPYWLSYSHLSSQTAGKGATILPSDDPLCCWPRLSDRALDLATSTETPRSSHTHHAETRVRLSQEGKVSKGKTRKKDCNMGVVFPRGGLKLTLKPKEGPTRRPKQNLPPKRPGKPSKPFQASEVSSRDQQPILIDDDSDVEILECAPVRSAKARSRGQEGIARSDSLHNSIPSTRTIRPSTPDSGQDQFTPASIATSTPVSSMGSSNEVLFDGTPPSIANNPLIPSLQPGAAVNIQLPFRPRPSHKSLFADSSGSLDSAQEACRTQTRTEPDWYASSFLRSPTLAPCIVPNMPGAGPSLPSNQRIDVSYIATQATKVVTSNQQDHRTAQTIAPSTHPLPPNNSQQPATEPTFTLASITDFEMRRYVAQLMAVAPEIPVRDLYDLLLETKGGFECARDRVFQYEYQTPAPVNPTAFVYHSPGLDCRTWGSSTRSPQAADRLGETTFGPPLSKPHRQANVPPTPTRTDRSNPKTHRRNHVSPVTIVIHDSDDSDELEIKVDFNDPDMLEDNYMSFLPSSPPPPSTRTRRPKSDKDPTRKPKPKSKKTPSSKKKTGHTKVSRKTNLDATSKKPPSKSKKPAPSPRPRSSKFKARQCEVEAVTGKPNKPTRHTTKPKTTFAVHDLEYLVDRNDSECDNSYEAEGTGGSSSEDTESESRSDVEMEDNFDDALRIDMNRSYLGQRVFGYS